MTTEYNIDEMNDNVLMDMAVEGALQGSYYEDEDEQLFGRTPLMLCGHHIIYTWVEPEIVELPF